MSKNILNEIIKRSPKYINAYINLGNLKRDTNNFNEAIKLYEKAIDFNTKLLKYLFSF